MTERLEIMDRQLIEALIDALERSSLSELEYERDGEILRLSKGGAGRSRVAEPVAVAAPSVVPTSSGRPRPPREQEPVGTVIAAPLYGVVHLRPAPEAENFVAVGQAVAAGQVLCTIEAMKVFTEVRADRAGTVSAICVDTGQEVEAGQTLVRLA